MLSRTNGNMGGALTLIGGAIVGAGVAILCAPRSGKATRREISSAARRSGRRMKRAARDFSDEVSSLIESAGEMSGSMLDRGRDSIRSAKREIADAFDAGGDMLHRQRRKLSRILP